MARLAATVDRVLAAAGAGEPASVGLGASGPIDPQTGRIDNPHTLPAWLNGPIGEALEHALRRSVTLVNDAAAAALGESWAGAGRGARRLLCVTVGTGIGVAFLRDGRIDVGTDGQHGEAGHHVIDPSGPRCYCGAHGCWESLCSGAAIARAALRTAREAPASADGAALADDGLDGAAVVAAAAAGNSIAQDVVARAAEHLGVALVNGIAFLVPDVVVLGGGVMEAYELFAGPVRAALERHAPMVPTAATRVVPAALGDRAGMVGAARAGLRGPEGPHAP